MKFIKLKMALFATLLFGQAKASGNINNRVLKVRDAIKNHHLTEKEIQKEGSIFAFYASKMNIDKSDNSAAWPVNKNEGSGMKWHNRPTWSQYVAPWNQVTWRNWNKF